MYNAPYCSMYDTVVRTNVAPTMYNQTYNVCNVAHVVRRMYCSKYHEKNCDRPAHDFVSLGLVPHFQLQNVSKSNLRVPKSYSDILRCTQLIVTTHFQNVTSVTTIHCKSLMIAKVIFFNQVFKKQQHILKKYSKG